MRVISLGLVALSAIAAAADVPAFIFSVWASPGRSLTCKSGTSGVQSLVTNAVAPPASGAPSCSCNSDAGGGCVKIAAASSGRYTVTLYGPGSATCDAAPWVVIPHVRPDSGCTRSTQLYPGTANEHTFGVALTTATPATKYNCAWTSDGVMRGASASDAACTTCVAPVLRAGGNVQRDLTSSVPSRALMTVAMSGTEPCFPMAPTPYVFDVIRKGVRFSGYLGAGVSDTANVTMALTPTGVKNKLWSTITVAYTDAPTITCISTVVTSCLKF